MPERITASSIIKSSLITAFTIAAALIWKDVIFNFITNIVPERHEIFYEFLVAVFATVIVIIAIFVIIKTESEAESFVKKIKKKNHRKR